MFYSLCFKRFYSKTVRSYCNDCTVFEVPCISGLVQGVTVKRTNRRTAQIYQPFSSAGNALIFNGPVFRKGTLSTKSFLVHCFPDHDIRSKLFSETSGRQKFYITWIKNLSSNSSSIRFSLIWNFSLFSFVLYSKFMK